MITINVRAHQNNSYTCSFCCREEEPVVGMASDINPYNRNGDRILFYYCKDCGDKQARKMLEVANPNSTEKKK